MIFFLNPFIFSPIWSALYLTHSATYCMQMSLPGFWEEAFCQNNVTIFSFTYLSIFVYQYLHIYIYIYFW